MKHFITSLVLLTLIITASSAADRPNIVLIMSDDMGYSDLGCFGSEISTPSLDQLAAGGVRFTQFYNTARCCPTRASLLTGLHPHQAGMGHMTGSNHGGLRGYVGDLLPTTVTIAEALKSAKYHTYAVGKWHVASQVAPEGSNKNWPLQRGFDRYYGILSGAANYFDPNRLYRDNTPISPFNDPEYKPNGEYYLTHAIGDNAVKFIKEHKAATPDEPFFMYVAFTAAHWPMQAPKDAVEKYKGKYDAGYTAIREARYKRQLQTGLISDKWELSPQAGDWNEVENKAWEARCMEVFAAMITEMDAGVGKIVGSLKETGLYDNTVIIFLQDNGACAENIGRTEPNAQLSRPDKPTFEPIPLDAVHPQLGNRTRDGYPIRRGKNVMPGETDTFVAYGRSWANVSDTPFREYKHWVHEGGISTPLIVHSPTKVAEKMRGKFYREPGQLVDLMATCVDLAGVTYPTKYNGNEITPAEGTSLVPGFSGESLVRTKPLVWEHEGNRAIRDGKWKLVAKGPLGDWELYDVEADRSELHNAAPQYPERVEKMSKDWNDWAVRTNVLPWPWDSKNKKNNNDNIKPDKTVGVKLEFDFTQPNADVIDKSGKNKAITLKGKFEQPVTKSVNASKYFDGSSYIEVEKSPALHCVQTAWSVETTIEPASPDGVILAYGGSRYGYSLTIQNNRPSFAVRIDNEIFAATSEKPISDKTTLKGV
ncbi:MAG: arylsulfatase, partial [Planctomycetaceae bacterium]|nr:arylsulfatase [Planctomycetaceae bacterium]